MSLQQIAPELQNIGMIRDMLWDDVDNDGDKDMIIARRLDGLNDVPNE